MSALGAGVRNSIALCLAFPLLVATAFAAEPLPADKDSAGLARDSVIRIVQQVQRADYEGDRASLNALYEQLLPFVDEPEIASRVRYWRGFAKWRRGVSGFNETPTPPDLADDLTAGESEFYAAIQRDPGFVDAKVGAASCVGTRLFLEKIFASL